MTRRPALVSIDVAPHQLDHARSVPGAHADAAVTTPVEQPPTDRTTAEQHPSAGGPWTLDRIRDLGAVTTVATAAAIFGLSRTSAYDLIRAGRFPLPVLRFGGRYRVPVPAILHALTALEDDPPEPTAEPPT